MEHDGDGCSNTRPVTFVVDLVSVLILLPEPYPQSGFAPNYSLKGIVPVGPDSPSRSVRAITLPSIRQTMR